ncbi:MFS transporter [Nocardiopsis coralliicola]
MRSPLSPVPPARWSVLAFGLGAFAVQADSFALSSALPAAGADLGVPPDRLAPAVGVYLLACTAAMVPAGRIGDSAGHGRVLAAALALFGAASALCAVAPGAVELAAFRAFQGLGGGAVMASGLALVGGDARAAGRALGWAATATVLGPALGGLAAATVGWRWLFAAAVPVAALALAAALAGDRGPHSGAARAPSGGGRPLVRGRAEQVRGERRPAGLLRNGPFLRATAAAAAANAATVVWLFAGPILLQGPAGAEAGAAGALFAAACLAHAAGAPLAGRWAARAQRPLAGRVLAVSAAGALPLAALSAAPVLGAVPAAAVLACSGLALGAANALGLLAARAAAPAHAAGAAAGTAKAAVTAAGALPMLLL